MNLTKTLTQKKLVDRYKTFSWNVIWTIATMVTAFALDLVPELELSQWAALGLTLVLQQVSKYVASQTKNG